MLILTGVVVGIAAGIVGIMTGVVRFVGWLKGIARNRAAIREGLRTTDEVAAGRLGQRMQVAKKKHATAVPMKTTRARSLVTPREDPWAGTDASGYGEVIRSDLRRRGVSPAGYARSRR